ncbi:transglycosylase domain-containing protein [Litorilinea aerophila]|nr:transglycosylase domain-containing protein [Litorilinea aerophila]MCC9075321.1 transglycosylase domain-containing protein [Litorilinea aerophila]
MRKWLGRRSFWLRLSLGLALVLVASGYGLYTWLLADLPPVSAVEQRLVRPTTQILDRHGRVLYEVIDPAAGKQISLDLSTLPRACIQATLATEDSRFYLHPGVDPLAILRAVWQNLRGREVISGGSTLTQQLARNLLMEPAERYQQSLRRKIREAWLAWQLERRYTKDELLALYLNQTYYGNFAFGIEAAAQIFFAKPAAQLSQAECALLAGLVQYPSGYNPLQHPDAAKERQLTVLRLMWEAGYLTDDQVQEIAAQPLRYRSRLFDIRAPHFVMYVQDILAQRLGPDRLRDGGLRVYTTLDLDLQRQAEASIRYRLDLLNCRIPGLCDERTDPNRRVDNAAAVVLDGQTGQILAMVGSPDYFDPRIQGNVNAALSLRQPGSAIKPLTYAAALDPAWSARLGLQPLTPASILADLPTTFYVRDEQGGNVPYQPLNYDRQFHGPVSVRTALANSYNVPAVKVLQRIGVPSLEQIAAQAGISTFTNEYGLALTLGGGEVKLLELTAAYGIFLDGHRRDPQAILAIEEVVDGVSRPLPGFQAPEATLGPQVIQPDTAYLITHILADPVARIPAFGEGSVLELPFPAAVKTGTTTDWRDNWTIGYSTRRIVGVWVGNADNTPMLDISGVDGAGPIWHDLMLAAHPTPPQDFPRPETITQVTICAPSGLLPSRDCPRTRQEIFIRGTEPTQVDNQFQRISVDLATGLRAGPDTPPERVAERVYWLLPPEYWDWMQRQGIPIPPPATVAQDSAPGRDQLVDASTNASPLVLSAPTSHTGYAIHPGVPRERQRIQVAGHVADGRPWAELRLMMDGIPVAEARQAAQLSAWWPLEPGPHHFWLEGRMAEDGPVVRSEQALVVVDDLTHAQPLTVSRQP